MKNNDIDSFLDEYKNAKKDDNTKDGKYKLKDKFKELWETYKVKNNPFTPQAKMYLIEGKKYDSHKLLWETLCERYSAVENAKNEVNEEFEENNKKKIPEELLYLFTFAKELSNQENEQSKLAKEINTLNNEILELNNDIKKRDNIISDLQQQIANLENALAEQKALTNIIAKDEAKKTQETYQEIANKLNYCYSLFQDSKDMEMSSDLGEVLRDQLRDIFSILSTILSKNGIILGA